MAPKVDRFRQLQMVLNAKVARGMSGAAKLRKQLWALPDRAAKLKFLQENVARASVQRGVDFEPSRATQLRSISRKELREDCVVKTMSNGSPALAKTLAVYGHVRACGKEHELPLPPLLRVVRNAKTSDLYFKYVGSDARKTCPVDAATFKRLRSKSIEQLIAAGFNKRISLHRANWAVTEHESSWRAVLLDTGRCSID